MNKKKNASSTRLSRLTPLTLKTSPTKTPRYSNAKSSRPGSARGQEEGWEGEEDQHEEWKDEAGEAELATSFLQYCAFCETQIEVPNSSILYCSEHCRKQDVSSQAYKLFDVDTPSAPHSTTSPGSTTTPVKDIIPQLSPTIISHRRSQSSPISDASPRSPRVRDQSSQPSRDHAQSEAATYLAEYHATAPLPSTLPFGKSATATSTPSLSYASTTASIASRPFTPLSSCSRPPPARRWGSSFSSRSVDLVTPVTQDQHVPSSITTITEKEARSTNSHEKIIFASSPRPEGLSYVKKTTRLGCDSSPGQGSLKKLFQFDQMRASAKVE